jgi:hypothetical protein
MVDLGEKEKTQILLNEYTSLRSEINARISNAFQVAAISAGALAVCLQVQMNTSTQKGVMLLIVCAFIVCATTAILLWIIFHNFFNAVLRVQVLEREVNRRADEELLIWENKRGGLAVANWWLIIVIKFFHLTR